MTVPSDRKAKRVFQFYQHDQVEIFRFVLLGHLEGSSVEDLQNAWITASSVTGQKPLVVDLSLLAGVDDYGISLLTRMRASGAQFVPEENPAVLRGVDFTGVPAKIHGNSFRSFAARLFSRCAG